MQKKSQRYEVKCIYNVIVITCYTIHSAIDEALYAIEDEIKHNFVSVYGEQAWEDFINQDYFTDTLREKLTNDLYIQ